MAKRRGRKRKLGQREKNGRLKREAPPERGWENMRVVLSKRCANRGLRPNVENLRKMRDAREGYVLGRILNDGMISEADHNAGLKFQALHVEWAAANGIPRINAPASSYGLRIAGKSDSSDQRAKASQDEYFAAANALISSGMLAEWETKRVCLENQEPKNMESLQNGLGRLREHFG